MTNQKSVLLFESPLLGIFKRAVIDYGSNACADGTVLRAVHSVLTQYPIDPEEFNVIVLNYQENYLSWYLKVEIIPRIFGPPHMNFIWNCGKSATYIKYGV